MVLDHSEVFEQTSQRVMAALRGASVARAALRRWRYIFFFFAPCRGLCRHHVASPRLLLDYADACRQHYTTSHATLRYQLFRHVEGFAAPAAAAMKRDNRNEAEARRQIATYAATAPATRHARCHAITAASRLIRLLLPRLFHACRHTLYLRHAMLYMLQRCRRYAGCRIHMPRLLPRRGVTDIHHTMRLLPRLAAVD